MTSATSQEADYVIIGGGTAGCVLANRLSQDSNVQVLLIESGKNLDGDPRVQDPDAWTSLLGPDASWQFETVPQPGLNGRVEAQPQGKVLGGSSAVNGSVFITPLRGSIDAWAKLGNPEWTYEELLPYFEMVCSVQYPEASACNSMGVKYVDKTNGSSLSSGPIQVSLPGLVQQHPIIKAWNVTLKGRGYTPTTELFPTKSANCTCYTAAVDDKTGKRSYAFSQYGVPALKRGNLTILTDSFVSKIRFKEPVSDGELLTAEGVELEHVNGFKTFVTARKEVIVSAGVFQTPKLLEHSGIGSAKVLERLGIVPTIVNEGVGEHMQNHVMAVMTLELESEVVQGKYIQALAFLQLQDTAAQRKLLDSSRPAQEDAAFHSAVKAILEEPDGASGSTFVLFTGVPNFASIGVMQSIPFSRGSCHATSADPAANPRIDPQFFANELDLEIMARHVLAVEELAASDEMAKFFKRGGERLPSGCKPVKTLEGAKTFLRNSAITTHHSCGTAAMLPREHGGVVDQELRVYGTSNLRVVDASIFPVIPQANPMPTVYAVAERAAALIKRST